MKENRKRKLLFKILISFILFMAAYAVNIKLISVEYPGLGYVPFRDLLLILALGFIYWGLAVHNPFQKWGLLKKLKRLGYVALLLWIIVQLIQWKILFPADTIPESNPVQDIYREPFFKTLLVYGICYFAVWIVLSLKDLIYVQRAKRTSGQYKFLIVLLVLHGMSSPVGLSESRFFLLPVHVGIESPGLDYILAGLLYLLMFINGFRCKWIHYLNKQQKIGIFFWFSLLLFAIFSLLIGDSLSSVFDYSENIGSFIQDIFMFFVTYSGMTVMGILFQLPAAGMMDKKKKEIQSFQTLSTTLGSVLDTDELVNMVSKLSQQFVNADITWLELKDNQHYMLAGTQNIETKLIERIPAGAIDKIRDMVHDYDNAILLNDIPKDRRISEFRKWRQRAGSLLAAPVKYKNRELGLIYALKRETFGFVEESRDTFLAFANQVGVALENVRLMGVTIDQERYREELRLAHDAQMRLLPQSMPKIQGLEIEGFCMTANEIGGDFYDVIPIEDNRLDLVIGDVSGKGASAAFYMAELKGMIRSLAQHHSSPKSILLEMNQYLHEHFDEQTFVTMVYGILWLNKKQIQIVRAGHPPIGHIQKNKLDWIEPKGLGLGLSPNSVLKKSLQEKTIRLQKEDTIILYTDGLTEARNEKDIEYGEERLSEALINLIEDNPKVMVPRLQDQLTQFTKNVSRHDDITLVVFKLGI